MAPRDRTQPLRTSELSGYVRERAPAFGLDPNAVLAVALQEGAGGGIGDGGTSFGPWQLHYGGALPSKVYRGRYSAQTNAWAWSPAGIDYALSRMRAAGAGDLQGRPAVEAIVRNFERPANPDAEVARALAAYGGPASGSRGPRPTASGGSDHGDFLHSLATIGHYVNPINGITAAWEAAFGSVGGAIGGVTDFVKAAAWLVSPRNWLRAVETFFGFLLMLLGLYFLGSAGDGGAVDARRVPGVGGAASAVKGAADLAVTKGKARRNPTTPQRHGPVGRRIAKRRLAKTETAKQRRRREREEAFRGQHPDFDQVPF